VKYLFLNYRRNKDKPKYLFLNYRRNKDKPKYLFLNYRRNEDEAKYLFLNYQRNEDEVKYLFPNYQRNEDEKKQSICSSTIKGTKTKRSIRSSTIEGSKTKRSIRSLTIDDLPLLVFSVRSETVCTGYLRIKISITFLRYDTCSTVMGKEGLSLAITCSEYPTYHLLHRYVSFVVGSKDIMKQFKIVKLLSIPPGSIAVLFMVLALSTPGQGWGGGSNTCLNAPAGNAVVSWFVKEILQVKLPIIFNQSFRTGKWDVGACDACCFSMFYRYTSQHK
jgi:hypothetical protein